MPKILITNNYDNTVKELIKGLKPNDFDLVFIEPFSKEEFLRSCIKVEYFLVGGRLPIDSEVLSKASQLKMIQRTGVGLDQIDLEYLKNNKIPLYVNKGINASAVAEHTLLLILAVLRKLNIADGLLKSGIWKKQALGVQTSEVRGKTIGLIGLGSICEKVALLLQPFGVKVLYNKRNRLDASIEQKLDIEYVSLASLFKHADIVSLHCSYNESTKEIINKSSIDLMKNEAIVINTSRGKLINELDLVDALKNRKVKGVGLDVFQEEPLSSESELTKLDNAILTPHVGGITKESFSDMFIKAFQNITHFEKGNLAEIESSKVC